MQRLVCLICLTKKECKNYTLCYKSYILGYYVLMIWQQCSNKFLPFTFCLEY